MFWIEPKRMVILMFSQKYLVIPRWRYIHVFQRLNKCLFEKSEKFFIKIYSVRIKFIEDEYNVAQRFSSLSTPKRLKLRPKDIYSRGGIQ